MIDLRGDLGEHTIYIDERRLFQRAKRTARMPHIEGHTACDSVSDRQCTASHRHRIDANQF